MKWGIKIDKKDIIQPLLIVYKQHQTIYLPTSLCRIVNLTQRDKLDTRMMKDLKNYTPRNPDQRYERISKLIAKF